MAKCICILSSVSLWGSTVITDKAVVKMISRATSLQHLNIGGTFITDTSLFAIADGSPQLNVKSPLILLFSGAVLITEKGLVAHVTKCCKLQSINVWGTRVPLDCFIGLLTINPALQIQPKGMLLNDQRVPMWPVFKEARFHNITTRYSMYSRSIIEG
ncbi:F-box protein [Abeliophyllum distichum]|uniref:F-box protein n=1 Tax=Abeliophyllum distichum TaxID=126358 RepID=A0ABD1SG06_9LAMI